MRVFQSLRERGLRVQIVQRLVRRGVGQGILLIERQANRPRQRNFIFRQLVHRRNQRLLLVLVIHLRAQHVQPRTGAGLMRRHSLVVAQLRGLQLRLHGVDARLVRDAEQVGVAHRQHHHVARILRGEPGGGKAVFRRKVSLQRPDVHQVLRQVGSKVDHLEGTHNRVDPRKLDAERCKVQLLHLD